MRIVSKRNFFLTEHIWFEEFTDIAHIKSSADRIIVHGNTAELQGKWLFNKKQYSSISDLTVSEEELFAQFLSTTKYEIRRAIREENKVEIYTSNQIIKDKDIIEDMADIYARMYEEKELGKHKLPVSEMLAYAQNGSLIISSAKIDSTNVVYHSYVSDGSTVRLLHSCSEFRVMDSSKKNAIGRANKLLHYEDIRYFKSIGVKRYDWGGISSYDNPNGIDKFKLSFGGSHIEYNNIVFFKTLKSKVLFQSLRLLKK